jgi:hypothetical protein
MQRQKGPMSLHGALWQHSWRQRFSQSPLKVLPARGTRAHTETFCTCEKKGPRRRSTVTLSSLGQVNQTVLTLKHHKEEFLTCHGIIWSSFSSKKKKIKRRAKFLMECYQMRINYCQDQSL